MKALKLPVPPLHIIMAEVEGRRGLIFVPSLFLRANALGGIMYADAQYGATGLCQTAFKHQA